MVCVCIIVYDAWGRVVSVLNEYGTAQTTATFIGNVNPIRYRGYYYDAETKLYYLQSRYYDPETCRFVNMDGYVQTGTGSLLDKNAYAYCEDDPMNYSDPTGSDPFGGSYYSDCHYKCDDSAPYHESSSSGSGAAAVVSSVAKSVVKQKAVSKADSVLDEVVNKLPKWKYVDTLTINIESQKLQIDFDIYDELKSTKILKSLSKGLGLATLVSYAWDVGQDYNNYGMTADFAKAVTVTTGALAVSLAIGVAAGAAVTAGAPVILVVGAGIALGYGVDWVSEYAKKEWID